jgi:catechol 2,3-dioxygenase-like lactoylglutathione lyase family enzyme
MRIESVSVPVGDQEQAKSFYVETLGFELLVEDTWSEGMRWSEVAPKVPRHRLCWSFGRRACSRACTGSSS